MGDITHIATSNGTVALHYIYDAYGQITDTENTAGYSAIADANPYRYRGYRYDSEISMYYLNSRYYNPEVGRFINADGMFGKVGELGTNNMYSYCSNNPIMLIDPSGELGILFWLAVSGIIYCIGTSVGGYATAAVMSIWDKDVRSDMNAIGWNPFNSDESKVANSNKVSFYKGQFVVRTNFAFTGHRSFSFGIMFLEKNVKDTPYGRDVIKHEWGHFVQLSILGVPKFVVFFAVPSMLSGGSSNYYSLPWERSADLFGGVSGSNWSSPHTSNSDIYSILYLIGVFVI